MKHANDNANDLLLGAKAIAEYLGVKNVTVYRMSYDDGLPAFKIGGRLAARRSSLTRWLSEKEKAAGLLA